MSVKKIQDNLGKSFKGTFKNAMMNGYNLDTHYVIVDWKFFHELLEEEGTLGKYESVCKMCFKPIKTEPYCWEKHLENYHKDITDKDNLDDFFMDLDLTEITALTGDSK